MNGGGVSNIGLGFTFSSRDLASGPINLLRGNFSQLRSSVTSGVPRIAAAFGVLAASVALVASGVSGIRGAFNIAQDAGQFNMAMADVASISGATANELEDLHDAAVNAGIVTQFAPTEAADGLRNLASNGVMARDSIDALVPVLDFAAAGSLSVGDAADVAMASLNAYGMGVENITSVTDRLMRGTQLSALRAEEFMTVMGRAASTGNLFGQSLDDVILALGSMRSRGIPATVATTSLGEAMRRVYTDTEAQRTLWNRFHVAVKDSSGSLRSIIDISHDLQGAMSGLTEAERARVVTEIFHVRGMQEFNAIANIQARIMRDGERVTLRGAEAIAYYRQELENAGGTTQEFRERRLATFQGAMVLLDGTVQTLGTVFGETFGNIFRPLIVAVTDALNLLIRAWTSLSDGMKKFLAVSFLGVSVFAIVAGSVGAIGSAIVLVVGLLGEIAVIAAAVAAGMVVALAPVIAAGAALVAVGYGLYKAWQQNLGGIRTFTETWAGRITRAWRGIETIFERGYLGGGALGDMLAHNEGGMISFLRAIERVVNNGRALWRGFRREFGRMWEQMGPQLEQLKNSLNGMLNQMIESGTVIATNAGDLPEDSYEQFGVTLAQVLVQGFMDIAYFAVVATEAITWLMDVFDSPAWNAFATVIGGIVDLFSTLYDIIQNFAAITETLNPLSWMAGISQAISGQDVTAIPLLNGGQRMSIAERIEVLTGINRPSESARERPPATERTQGPSREEILSKFMRERGGGGRPIDIRNRVSVQVDGRELAESENRNRVEESVYGGDFSLGQSVWTD